LYFNVSGVFVLWDTAVWGKKIYFRRFQQKWGREENERQRA